jgi:amidophosphoribosyltransferase
VHVRIGSPPIIAPCFYGIDMSTLGELFAPKYLKPGYGPEDLDAMCDQVARQLGADSLRYLPVSELAGCVGLPHEHLCTACVTTNYPTRAGARIYEHERRRKADGVPGRSYEADVLKETTEEEPIPARG